MAGHRRPQGEGMFEQEDEGVSLEKTVGEAFKGERTVSAKAQRWTLEEWQGGDYNWTCGAHSEGVGHEIKPQGPDFLVLMDRCQHTRRGTESRWRLRQRNKSL